MQGVALEKAPHEFGSVRPGRIAELSGIPAVPAVPAPLDEQGLDGGALPGLPVSGMHPWGTAGDAGAFRHRPRRVDAKASGPRIANVPGSLNIDDRVVAGVDDEYRARTAMLAHDRLHGTHHLLYRFELDAGWRPVRDRPGRFRIGHSGDRRAGGDFVGVCHHGGYRHAAPGGQPGDVYPPTIDTDFSPDLLDDLPEVFDFTRTRPNFTVEPPAPAISHPGSGIAGNKWIHDNETLAICNRVEIGDASNVGAVLAATVQNHEQWHRGIVTVAAGQVQFEASGSRPGIRTSAENPARCRRALVRLINVQRLADESEEAGNSTTDRKRGMRESSPLSPEPAAGGVTVCTGKANAFLLPPAVCRHALSGSARVELFPVHDAPASPCRPRPLLVVSVERLTHMGELTPDSVPHGLHELIPPDDAKSRTGEPARRLPPIDPRRPFSHCSPNYRSVSATWVTVGAAIEKFNHVESCGRR